VKTVEHERLDWTIVVVIILVIGFLCVIFAGQLAARFAPSWQLNTDMESHLDPNSTFVASRPDGFIEPVDAAILTPPGWINEFLTPGVSIITGTPFPAWTPTSLVAPTATTASTPTGTPAIASSPTNTLIFIPWTATATQTRKPRPTKTQPPSTNPADTPTLTPSSSTATQTFTVTATATLTSTPTTTETPVIIPTDTTPPEIGTSPDGDVYILQSGGTLTLGISLVANGDGSYDLAYYERPAPGGTGIFLDWVIMEIGDGTSWYTVFNWGNNLADTNSNMDFNVLPNPQVPEETDQRDIPTSALYNGSGIAIDVDALVPPGTYSYLRFTAPVGDSDNQMEIDAVEVLP
jgi:hypothetical protein